MYSHKLLSVYVFAGASYGIMKLGTTFFLNHAEEYQKPQNVYYLLLPSFFSFLYMYPSSFI